MHPDLARCREALGRLLAGLSPAQADAPRGDKWSIAMVLEHLDLAFTLNAAGLDRRLRKGAAQSRPRSWRQHLARLIVVKAGYFPTGRKSPDAVVPQGRPFAEVAAGLDAHLVDLDRKLSEVEASFGASKAVLDHPILGPLSVNDWRRFHWVHTRHHLNKLKVRS